jgi:hypothetical protein
VNVGLRREKRSPFIYGSEGAACRHKIPRAQDKFEFKDQSI